MKKRSAHYCARFNRDYAFCINKSFSQVYATSNQYCRINRQRFLDFCRAAEIPPATRRGCRAWEIPVTGAYPKTGKVPTKISFLKGDSERMKILISNLFGAYKP